MARRKVSGQDRAVLSGMRVAHGRTESRKHYRIQLGNHEG